VTVKNRNKQNIKEIRLDSNFIGETFMESFMERVSGRSGYIRTFIHKRIHKNLYV